MDLRSANINGNFSCEKTAIREPENPRIMEQPIEEQEEEQGYTYIQQDQPPQIQQYISNSPNKNFGEFDTNGYLFLVVSFVLGFIVAKMFQRPIIIHSA